MPFASNGDAGQFANDFGKLWIASAIVCALAWLNRCADAAPQIERMRGQQRRQSVCRSPAPICAPGDDDAAAALMVHRLAERRSGRPPSWRSQDFIR